MEKVSTYHFAVLSAGYEDQLSEDKTQDEIVYLNNFLM